MLRDAQRFLTGSEIADFLVRHPLIAFQVAATNAAVATLGFDQIYTPPAWYEIDVRVPGLILPNGICIADSSYGNVLIAPNSAGTLYYNAFVDAAHCAAAQQDWTGSYQPPAGSGPVSCPGWANISDWNDFLACAGNAAGLLTVAIGLWAASVIYRNVKH